jgi:hypothetical protein
MGLIAALGLATACTVGLVLWASFGLIRVFARRGRSVFGAAVGLAFAWLVLGGCGFVLMGLMAEDPDPPREVATLLLGVAAAVLWRELWFSEACPSGVDCACHPHEPRRHVSRR